MKIWYVQPDPPIQGWMSAAELQWLFEQARKHHCIAEIGCWCGKSTHALLSGCRGLVFAVDHFLGSASERTTTMKLADGGEVRRRFLANCGHFPNLQIFEMDSLEAAAKLPDGFFDMIFIDGEHTLPSVPSVLADLKAWEPKLAPGGLFCGHDRDLFISGIADVAPALRAFYGFDPPGVCDSIWAVCK